MKSISVKEIIKATGATLLCGNEDIIIEGASINSRQINENDLFIPIVGEKVDAHKFMFDALKTGASVSFTSKHTKEDVENESLSDDKAVLKVDDTLRALQALAQYSRSRFNLPLVGITGSVGKTTTKEMVATALEAKYNTLRTEGNLNSQIGLSLMMLRFEDAHAAAVIEMGVSEEGEMNRLVAIAKPEFAVMTNIGMSHINQFKKKENTRREKLNIIDYFKEKSVLYVNADDELLREIAQYKNNPQKEMLIDDETKKALDKCKVTTFGTSPEYDFYATDIVTGSDGMEFTCNAKDGRSVPVKLNVPGMHNVINALAAIAVADGVGISMEDAAKALLSYKTIAMRGTIIDNGKFKIIDDTYNASPDSIKSGIDVVTGIKDATRKYAVLADVLELGEVSHDCHYEVGKYVAASSVDELVTVGNEAKYIAKAVNDAGVDKKVVSFDSNEDAINYLKDTVTDGAVLLVKGSRGMHMDEIVKALS